MKLGPVLPDSVSRGLSLRIVPGSKGSRLYRFASAAFPDYSVIQKLIKLARRFRIYSENANRFGVWREIGFSNLFL